MTPWLTAGNTAFYYCALNTLDVYSGVAYSVVYNILIVSHTNIPRIRANLSNTSNSYIFIMVDWRFGETEFVAEKGSQLGSLRLLRRHCTCYPLPSFHDMLQLPAHQLPTYRY